MCQDLWSSEEVDGLMEPKDKITYVIGFLDCWQMFKTVQRDPNVKLKKGYIFERLSEKLTPTMTETELVELIDQCREMNLIHEISEIMMAKKQRDHMIKILGKKPRLDLSKL